jgi:hypothetical protein
MVELDDQVAKNLQAAATLVDTLQKDPRTRRGLLGLIKTVKPDASIPELDASKPLEDKIDALPKGFETFKNGLVEKDQNAQLEAERARLRTEHGFTDEGIKELEKFMLAKNVGDHEVARLALEASKPKPSPLRPQFSVRSVFSDDAKSDEEWMNNPDLKLDNELNKAFDAIQNGMM